MCRCRLGCPKAAMSSLTPSGMRLQQQRVAARPTGTHSGSAKLTASAQVEPLIEPAVVGARIEHYKLSSILPALQAGQ